ncbi:hypothetical protein GOODEAATRI_015042 [Goodea atripinnis]|uniref:Threonylcarbamoyl-AMP synthase n=1 Tax=Goodea atripinnis TaxID=208336 RepID=A0ABV0NAR8_9TELE
MCKVPKTKLLRLLPPTSNGPVVHQETHTGTHVSMEFGIDQYTGSQSVYDSEILSCTVKALKDGHIVAVPTDTIYGLACLAQNTEAVKKIYGVKERNGQKPLAIYVWGTTGTDQRQHQLADQHGGSTCKSQKQMLGFERCAVFGKLNVAASMLKEFQELWSKLAVVVDGGPIGDETRQGSTVIDLSVLGKYRVIRPGW